MSPDRNTFDRNTAARSPDDDGLPPAGGCRWWDIGGHAHLLAEVARCRDEQKAGYASTKNWTPGGSTHFTGLCAEFAVFLETGLPLDLELRAGGDPGHDFAHAGLTYDAKGVTHWRSPDLKEFPGRKKYADRYLLAAVREFRRVLVAGWATREQLLAAGRKSYGFGDMLSVPYPTLREWGQLGLPPELPRRTPERLDEIDVKLRRKAVERQGKAGDGREGSL